MRKRIFVIVSIISILFSSYSGGDEVMGEQKPYDSFHLATYEELRELIGQGDTSSYDVPPEYVAAVEKMIQTGIPIPCKNGTPISLDERPNSGGIWVTTFGFAVKPTIVYRTGSAEELICVQVALEWDKASAFTDDDSGSEILRALYPDDTNLHNTKSKKWGCSADKTTADEVHFTTTTGEKTALRVISSTENKGEQEERLTFMQNGFLVSLTARKGLITQAWIKDFSIDLMFVEEPPTAE